uniref:Uncharacterized protein n=1 Tax=Ditylenchus dipsaci TaxID=166011 RepID=A0A915EMY9_9BILA
MTSSPKTSNSNRSNQHYYRCAAQDKLAVSLAARECISRLCLDSQQTLHLLKNRRGSDVCTSSAGLNGIAMSVLKRLFRSLKNDICYSKYNNSHSEVLGFLGHTKDEPSSEIVDRYVSQWLEKRSRVPSVARSPASSSKWRQIENVPPLNATLVEQCCYSPSANSPQVHNNPEALKVLSYQEIPVGEASSSGESSLSSSSLSLQLDQHKLQLLTREVAQEVIESVRVVQEVVCKVDRSCGPTPRQQNGQYSPRIHEYDSKLVQTNDSVIEKVDVGVNTQQISQPVSENMSSSNPSTSYTTSNSSAMYSDLSAGQLPLHKAAILMARSQCHIVNVLADGSLPLGPMLTSTPTTGHHPPRVRDIDEPLFQQPQPVPNLNIDSCGQPPSRPISFHRPTVHEYLPSDSAELGSNPVVLMAREMSVGTSFDSLSPKNRSSLDTQNGGMNKFAVDKTRQKNGESQSNSSANAKSHLYSSENEDEESTLNQISPLPTTG